MYIIIYNVYIIIYIVYIIIYIYSVYNVYIYNVYIYIYQWDDNPTYQQLTMVNLRKNSQTQNLIRPADDIFHGKKIPVVTRRDPWDDRRIASRCEIRAPRAVRPRSHPAVRFNDRKRLASAKGEHVAM